MKAITLELLYDKMVSLERDISQIKKKLTEEPPLRDEFIARMKDVAAERTITVKDFGKRYGLRK